MLKYIKTVFWTSLAGISLVAAFLTFHHSFNYKMPPFLSFPNVTKNTNSIIEKFSNPQDLTEISTPNSTTTPTQVSTKKKTPPPLSYGDAVAKYWNSRIQFNSLCQSPTGRMATANPVTIMLDNRSDSTQVIVIGKQTYNIKAFGFALATLNYKNLPVLLPVKCNDQFNAAEIILQ